MYNCYICGNQSHIIHTFRSRLQTHLVLGELTYPVKCRPKQRQCKSTFIKLLKFLHHLRQFHDLAHMLTPTPYCVTNTNLQADNADVNVYTESDNDLPVTQN